MTELLLRYFFTGVLTLALIAVALFLFLCTCIFCSPDARDEPTWMRWIGGITLMIIVPTVVGWLVWL